MKKTLFLVATLAALCSCSESEIDNNMADMSRTIETRSVSDEVSVQDGTLVFPDYDTYLKTYLSLYDMDDEELFSWSSSKPNYTSMLEQETFSPNMRLSEDDEDGTLEEKPGDLNHYRKALYSNRGLMIIGDTIYKVLGDYIYRVPTSSRDILDKIDSNPDAYASIRVRHTIPMQVVLTAPEVRANVTYKTPVAQSATEARTPLSKVSSKRREHVKFVSNTENDAHVIVANFGLKGRAQKKKIGIWGRTFDDEMVWGQGVGYMTLNGNVKRTWDVPRVENAKESIRPYVVCASGQMKSCVVEAYFDCYKNDVSGEEHYKCEFRLNN